MKKVLRAQKIAARCNLPLIYLVDSAGVYLPMQDEIFPDEDDFGRIFRNNAVLSAMGVPQYAAIMGNCVAGGAYLPVLCDKMLMTEGSELYLAGPALVKAAIGQDVDAEELGGAAMHAADQRHRRLSRDRTTPPASKRLAIAGRLCCPQIRAAANPISRTPGRRSADALRPRRARRPAREYDVRDLLACIVDAGSLQEYKAEYGKTLVCAYAVDRRASKSASSPTSGIALQDRAAANCRSAA